ncbi:MAG TPA: TfuA-like protein [Kofleriaceae bacterium]
MIVFTGPTLSASEVLSVLPRAEVRPPAGVGDILAIATRNKPPKQIALIDGYFEGMAAVWHKEILLALERGIAVSGAASMGAIRAAELAPFGMRGVGQIYRDFKAGTLVADDEVAVAHLPPAQGYRAISEALVNLRYGIGLAQKQRIIPAITATTLIGYAKARFYRERTWEAVLAEGAHLPKLDRLRAWLATEPEIDRKALDARLLLAQLKKPVPARKRIAVPRTWALRQLMVIVSKRG